MPGRLFLTTPIEAIAKAVGAPATPGGPAVPRLNIRPGQDLCVYTRRREMRYMRWGIVPVGRVNARGRPVMETLVNARSETVFSKSAFEGVQRCAVPADGWYEWTGEKRRKTALRLREKSGRFLWFAAICDTWKGPRDIEIDQVAILTCEPNREVAEVHHRMGVILARADLDAWLVAPQDEAADLLRPWPDGRIAIEPATEVDFSRD